MKETKVMENQTGQETKRISQDFKKLNRCFAEYDPGATRCPKDKLGVHDITVEGQPLSGNTYNRCVACGLRWFRG